MLPKSSRELTRPDYFTVVFAILFVPLSHKVFWGLGSPFGLPLRGPGGRSDFACMGRRMQQVLSSVRTREGRLDRWRGMGAKDRRATGGGAKTSETGDPEEESTLPGGRGHHGSWGGETRIMGTFVCAARFEWRKKS